MYIYFAYAYKMLTQKNPTPKITAKPEFHLIFVYVSVLCFA